MRISYANVEDRRRLYDSAARELCVDSSEKSEEVIHTHKKRRRGCFFLTSSHPTQIRFWQIDDDAMRWWWWSCRRYVWGTTRGVEWGCFGEVYVCGRRGSQSKTKTTTANWITYVYIYIYIFTRCFIHNLFKRATITICTLRDALSVSLVTSIDCANTIQWSDCKIYRFWRMINDESSIVLSR